MQVNFTISMRKINIVCIIFLLVNFFACSRKDPAFNASDFPTEIHKILTKQCATVGCHNEASYRNAANLNLTSYENLLKGSSNGSVVIPFSPNQSSFMQFVNTYADLGLITKPSMPLNQNELSRDEVLLFKNWIANGCPNKQGDIPFSTESNTRSKAYITNQGCDKVSVIDTKTGLVMRYIEVGNDAQIEIPHNIQLSSDGKYWYVCFANGAYVQKFDANTDKLIGQVNIGLGSWNVIHLNSSNTKALVSNLESNGKLVEINLTTMSISRVFEGANLFSFPHGIAYSQTNDTIYITAQNGNMVYRLIPTLNRLNKISLQQGVNPIESNGDLEPHEIVAIPNKSVFYVTCQKSNEVRRFENDTITAIIPVGSFPLEMAYSPKRNLLFVSCENDNNTQYPNFKGSISVIDVNTNQVIRTIYETFYQPHGLAVDDKNDVLYVASRNVDANGPAPHHKSECNGSNGFYHIIDLNTWQTKVDGFEISVDPYSVGVRK